MNTSDILDLFQLGDKVVDKHKGSVTIGGGPMDQSGGGNTIKNILEGVHDVEFGMRNSMVENMI